MNGHHRDEKPAVILVVDDDKIARLLLRRFLDGEGYQVLEAENGPDALQILQETPVDLVVLDVVMPGMSGISVCSRIHELRISPPPVLIMTSIENDKEVDQVFEAGAVDYIRKPFPWTLLLNRIRHILSAHKANKELVLLTKKYETILHSADNGICGFDKEGKLNFINRAARRMLGYADGENILGRHCQDILHVVQAGGTHTEKAACPFVEAGKARLPVHYDEGRMKRQDGSTFPVDFRAAPIIQDNNLTGGVVVFQDITVRQQAAEMIRHMATHDSLTKLPNRNYLLQRISQAVSLATRQMRKLFLLFIDLDRFKPINDQHGHLVGDAVLVAVSERLIKTMRASDSVCRLGGDEFVILLESAVSLNGAILVAERVIDLLNEPIPVKEHICHVGASIGIAIFPDDSENGDILLRHADQAMYIAKNKGRNCWHLYGDRFTSAEPLS